jgi:hypothetical protein
VWLPPIQPTKTPTRSTSAASGKWEKKSAAAGGNWEQKPIEIHKVK